MILWAFWPVIVTAEILVQSLWKLEIGWDYIVPAQMLDIWQRFRMDLPCLNNININRRVICDNPTVMELHGFSDASEKAYGCCIYIRSVDQFNNISVNLVCS